MKQTAVLFDLDGVLIDTEGQYSDFWKRIGQSYYPEKKDFAKEIKGKTLVQIYQQYFSGQVDVQHAITQALAAFEQQMSFAFIPGAFGFVASLRQEGYKVAVVTSSNQEKLRCLLNEHPDFYSYFDRVFTAEDATRSKPAPDCYLSAAASFGFDAADCYVFEDSLNGLRAGLDSGATVVGVATTYDAERIAPFCHYVIHDFTNFSVADMRNLKK